MYRSVLIITVLCTVINGLPISSEIQNAEYFGNDMIFVPQPRGVAAIPKTRYLWPNGTVPYEMTSSILPEHQTLITEQMRAMENMTRVNGVNCITFRPKVASDGPFFIAIQNGTGCSATLGYNTGWTGTRTLNLLHTSGPTCMINGTIQHELLHVLGFYHEQSRPDRDQYVRIEWSNVMAGYEHNFNIYNESEVDTQQTPYDHGSVMHYDVKAFAINPSLPTIVPIQATNATIGQRVKMSPIDILEVQKYYGCLPASSTTAAPSTAAPSSSSTAATSSSSSTAVPSSSSTTAPTSSSSTAAPTSSLSTASTTPNNNTTPNRDHLVVDGAEAVFVPYWMMHISFFVLFIFKF